MVQGTAEHSAVRAVSLCTHAIHPPAALVPRYEPSEMSIEAGAALHRALEVMKFAKQLKEAKQDKYEGCYFGYSSLKTTLKQLVEQKPNIKGYLQAAEHGLTDREGNQFYDDHAGKEMTMVETFIESKGFQVRRKVDSNASSYGQLSAAALLMQ
jgi:hypothetical protein